MHFLYVTSARVWLCVFYKSCNKYYQQTGVFPLSLINLIINFFLIFLYISKIFENIFIFNQLKEYLLSHGLCDKYQSGF